MQRHGTQSRELLIARCAPPANDSYGGSHGDIWDPCPFFIESSENLSSLQAPWHVRIAGASVVLLIFRVPLLNECTSRVGEIPPQYCTAATSLVLHRAKLPH